MTTTEKLAQALELIASTDAVDAALDPQRAVRVAREALASHRSEPEARQHIPLSANEEREIDERLGLVQLPPVRLPKEIADRLSMTAAAEGVIVQALVWEILRERFGPINAADLLAEEQATQQAGAVPKHRLMHKVDQSWVAASEWLVGLPDETWIKKSREQSDEWRIEQVPMWTAAQIADDIARALGAPLPPAQAAEPTVERILGDPMKGIGLIGGSQLNRTEEFEAGRLLGMQQERALWELSNAEQTESVVEAEPAAWLIEWKTQTHGPQWWGFNYEPGKRGSWCGDVNRAIRFARREDAERMRVHIIAAEDMTGKVSYEERISVTEHMWPGEARPVEAAGMTDEQIHAGCAECGVSIASGTFPEVAFIRGVRWAERQFRSALTDPKEAT